MVYAPLWDQEELAEAADLLGLTNRLAKLQVPGYPRCDSSWHDQDVNYRYDVFGGVDCTFLSASMHVDNQVLEIQEAVSQINLQQGRYMSQGKNLKVGRHRLLLSLRRYPVCYYQGCVAFHRQTLKREVQAASRA